MRRAREDPDFAALLRRDPRAALEELIGTALPRRLEVQVLEERTDRLCLVLPVDLSGISAPAARVATGDHSIGVER